MVTSEDRELIETVMEECQHNMVNGGEAYVCTNCNRAFDWMGNPLQMVFNEENNRWSFLIGGTK